MIQVDAAAGRLTIRTETWPCAIGRGGAVPAAAKCEGDGATPLGSWPVRGVLLRPDRALADTRPHVPWRWIRPDDGWSDDPADPAYNRAVILPRRYGHERLWREDGAYDAVVVLGHNDAPPLSGLGSAIFLHLLRTAEDGTPKPTEGCVAVAPPAMRLLLATLRAGDVLTVA